MDGNKRFELMSKFMTPLDTEQLQGKIPLGLAIPENILRGTGSFLDAYRQAWNERQKAIQERDKAKLDIATEKARTLETQVRFWEGIRERREKLPDKERKALDSELMKARIAAQKALTRKRLTPTPPKQPAYSDKLTELQKEHNLIQDMMSQLLGSGMAKDMQDALYKYYTTNLKLSDEDAQKRLANPLLNYIYVRKFVHLLPDTTRRELEVLEQDLEDVKGRWRTLKGEQYPQPQTTTQPTVTKEGTGVLSDKDIEALVSRAEQGDSLAYKTLKGLGLIK